MTCERAVAFSELDVLAFASTAKAMIREKEVDAMHACGDDTHTAMLVGLQRCWQKLKGNLAGPYCRHFKELLAPL